MDEPQKQQLVATIKAAFQPLRTAVEIHDYDFRAKLRVFGADDKGVLSVEDLKIATLEEKSNLNTLLQDLRQRVIDKGHKLNKWNPG